MNSGYNDCCGGGGGSGDKWTNWLMGLGVGTTLLGGILGMFGIGGKGENDGVVADNTGDNDDEYNRLLAENKRLKEEGAKKTASSGDQVASKTDKYGTFGAKQYTSTETLTEPYEVKRGDNPYAVIKGKYINSDGTPISNEDALAIARAMFKGKGLKAGIIQLDKTIEHNGKTFTYNAAGTVTPGTVENVNMEYFQSENVKQISKNEWAPIVNGEEQTERCSSKAEAEKIAQEKLKALGLSAKEEEK